jgi:hypothetical protein
VSCREFDVRIALGKHDARPRRIVDGAMSTHLRFILEQIRHFSEGQADPRNTVPSQTKSVISCVRKSISSCQLSAKLHEEFGARSADS